MTINDILGARDMLPKKLNEAKENGGVPFKFAYKVALFMKSTDPIAQAFADTVKDIRAKYPEELDDEQQKAFNAEVITQAVSTDSGFSPFFDAEDLEWVNVSNFSETYILSLLVKG